MLRRATSARRRVPDDLLLKIKVSGADFDVTQSGGGQAEQNLHFNTEGKK